MRCCGCPAFLVLLLAIVVGLAATLTGAGLVGLRRFASRDFGLCTGQKSLPGAPACAVDSLAARPDPAGGRPIGRRCAAHLRRSASRARRPRRPAGPHPHARLAVDRPAHLHRQRHPWAANRLSTARGDGWRGVGRLTRRRLRWRDSRQGRRRHAVFQARRDAPAVPRPRGRPHAGALGARARSTRPRGRGEPVAAAHACSCPSSWRPASASPSCCSVPSPVELASRPGRDGRSWFVRTLPVRRRQPVLELPDPSVRQPAAGLADLRPGTDRSTRHRPLSRPGAATPPRWSNCTRPR